MGLVLPISADNPSLECFNGIRVSDAEGAELAGDLQCEPVNVNIWKLYTPS